MDKLTELNNKLQEIKQIILERNIRKQASKFIKQDGCPSCGSKLEFGAREISFGSTFKITNIYYEVCNNCNFYIIKDNKKPLLIDTDLHLLKTIKISWEISKERQSIMEEDYDILPNTRKIDTAFQAGRTSAFKEVLDFVTKHLEMQQSKEVQ